MIEYGYKLHLPLDNTSRDFKIEIIYFYINFGQTSSTAFGFFLDSVFLFPRLQSQWNLHTYKRQNQAILFVNIMKEYATLFPLIDLSDSIPSGREGFIYFK